MDLKLSDLLEDIQKNLSAKEFYNINIFVNDLMEQVRLKSKSIDEIRVLIGFGGGKDSSWVISFLRTAQLLCQKKYNKTFAIDVVTMIHLGMPFQVFENIDAVYSKLQMYNQDNITLNIYSYGSIGSFQKNNNLPENIKRLLREDILVFANKCFADPRPTFCYSCNFHMVNSFISNIRKDTCFILSGDSKEELTFYEDWLKTLFSRYRIGGESSELNLKQGILNFINFEKKVLEDIFPDEDDVLSRIPKIDKTIIPSDIKFIIIHNYTQYQVDAHKDFLYKFLGFKLHKETLNFSESDCRYPLVMAHIRGISAEESGRGYEQGIKEYLQLGNSLMRSKSFPEQIIQEVNSRYSPDNIEYMRRITESYLNDELNISNQQLVCAIYSPFPEHALNLHQFLAKKYPEMLERETQIRAALAGENTSKDQDIIDFLEKVSGLRLQYLQKIYKSNIVYPLIINETACTKTSDCILEVIREKDPHKKQIEYILNDGREIKEIITGR
ncbi:MAG: hypothetical protein K6U80_15670 [Firmicutes bacterium]|nr:hypothetical protein [Bacillota bacterium]